MNEDLAFCLEQFANDQIAESTKEIERQAQEFQIQGNILKNQIDRTETIIRQQEYDFIEQFSVNLKENHTSLIKTRHIIANELQEILRHASSHIDRVAKKAVDKQADEAIRKASNQLRRQNEQFESELTRLISVIDQNITDDCSVRITIWFETHFKHIEVLNQFINKNEHSKISQVLLIKHSNDRQDYWKDRDRLIDDFVEQLEIEDLEEKNDLINSLNNRRTNIGEMIKYSRLYIQERQEKRRIRKEESIREMERIIEEKHLEQQTRTIQLAEALRQLAFGSNNEKHFNQRFNQILNQSKVSEKFVPIITDHIDQPTVKELLLIIRLQADFNTWESNELGIQEEFCSALSNAYKLPKDTIRIKQVEKGNAVLDIGIKHVEQDTTVLHISVQPPHGQTVIDKISNVNTIQNCCKKFHSPIYSITLGEFGLKVETRLMNPRWNRIYIHDNGQSGGTFWTGSLNRGGKPYFCPKGNIESSIPIGFALFKIGWTRYGIKVAESSTEFDAKWGSWYIAYHGTQGINAPLILQSGLRTSTSGCFAIHERSSVYLTPSIEYAAHPRYARPWQKTSNKNEWFQLVFQCRVNPQSVGNAHSETLINLEYKGKFSIDENFSNDQLTWIIPSETADITYIRDNIICYGIMIRKTEFDPKELSSSKWWQYSIYHNIKYNSV